MSCPSPDGQSPPSLAHLNQTLRSWDYDRDPDTGSVDHLRKRAAISGANLHQHVYDFDLMVEVIECAGMRIEMLELLEPWHQVALATKQ
jgi:hypothetical protein